MCDLANYIFIFTCMHYCYHFIAMPLVIVLSPAILFELHCAIFYMLLIINCYIPSAIQTS